jgi:hypothetical protein
MVYKNGVWENGQIEFKLVGESRCWSQLGLLVASGFANRSKLRGREVGVVVGRLIESERRMWWRR